MPYSLAKNVFYCIADGRVVFLDVTNARYFCMSGNCDAAFRGLLKSQTASPAASDGALVSLLQRGLLYESPQGNLGDPARIQRPSSSMFDIIFKPAKPIEIVEAWCERVRAAVSLRQMGFSGTIKALSRRKVHFQNIDADRSSLLSGAFAFHVARKWIASNDQCLPRSVAMINFYNRRSLRTNLVIGVTTQPFSAHAWVQQDDLVLNDTLEKVLPYTPIMVI